MTPKSEFGSRVKFFFWKFSLEMIEFILIRNPNEILRVKLSKLGFHFQNFIPYKKQPELENWVEFPRNAFERLDILSTTLHTTRALIKNLHCFWQWTVTHRLPSAPPLSVWSPNKVYASDGNRYFGFWRAFRDRKHNYRPTEARPLSSTDGLNSGLRENPNCHFQTENIQIFWKFSIIRISISFWIFIEDFAYYFTTNRTFLVG